MAAILEPRHLPAPVRQGPRPAPRHLRAVVDATGSRPAARTTPASATGRVAAPASVSGSELWVSPAGLAGMVATVVMAIVLALAVAAGAFAGLVPGPGTGSASAPVVAGAGAAVVVQPGDSYWSIARGLQPEGDVRPLVHRLQLLNGGVALRPGMEVVLPA
jgi:hypothetical protein